VPDSEGQFTSDHGWDIAADGARLKPLIDECHSLGVRVSLFMDSLPLSMPAVLASGADRIELYTEPFAAAYLRQAQAQDLPGVLQSFAATAAAAQALGLGVNAGHDLNRDNLSAFLQAVPGVMEVSIGHALVADALELGLGEAVRAYLRCIPVAV
jgi:pyridoxine 5-phosphate synthase